MNGNRAIRLTAGGSSALAVVRVVGPKVGAFLAKYFSRPVPPTRAVHGDFVDGVETIDDPVVVRTSPESADISLHGSPYLVHAVLGVAHAFGFVVDETLRADQFPDAAGLWAEVMASLPLARTPLAVKALLAQPQAWADAGRVGPHVSEDRALQTLLSLPTVAIVGPANVGKSTLANTLFGQQRSITADLPGTTRDWVGGIADIGGLAVTLIDTPGVRETADAVERAAQAASAGPARAADLVIVVLDRSVNLTDAGRTVMELHPTALRVANKSDRSAAWRASVENAIETVATADAGVEPLRKAIIERFGCGAFEINTPRLWSDDQRDRFSSGNLDFSGVPSSLGKK